MTFSQFLDSLNSSVSLMQHPVIAFQGGSYPLLFFSLLCNRLKEQGIALEIIDFANDELSQLESKFHTSFLGAQRCFWLKDASQLNDRSRKWLYKFVADYQGPHVIAFFAQTDTPLLLNKQSLSIIIPDTIDQKTVQAVIAFAIKNAAANGKIVAQICKGRDAIALDTACVLMHYAQVLGASTQTFVAEWLDQIIPPEQSLFTLSAHFFAKKPKLFFTMWAVIGPQYSEVFWVTYWSEAIWRAHYYCALTQSKQFGEAKKISNRLPFTFIQRDWKLHSLSHLRQAHQQLYEIDFALKNGAGPEVLELFYSQFFSM
jgi:hypothetical protein